MGVERLKALPDVSLANIVATSEMPDDAKVSKRTQTTRLIGAYHMIVHLISGDWTSSRREEMGEFISRVEANATRQGIILEDSHTPLARSNNALELEALLHETISPESPIPSADLQVKIERRILDGDRQLRELLGRPPVRYRLYTLLGDLVLMGHAEDTAEGFVLHAQDVLPPS